MELPQITCIINICNREKTQPEEKSHIDRSIEVDRYRRVTILPYEMREMIAPKKMGLFFLD